MLCEKECSALIDQTQLKKHQIKKMHFKTAYEQTDGEIFRLFLRRCPVRMTQKETTCTMMVSIL